MSETGVRKLLCGVPLTKFCCHGFFRYYRLLGCLGSLQPAALSRKRIFREYITQPDRQRTHHPPSSP
jgi:hypothetical protein